MTDDGRHTAGSALSRDSVGDKAVRFGCGAILAGLALFGAVLSGLGEPMGMSGLIMLGILVVVVSGALSVAFGERYIERLLRLMKWLS